MENTQEKNQLAENETIIVDLDKIERLVNKVADLVITNSMMSQNIKNINNHDDKKKMQETTVLFERHIKDIQDYAMELRMINMTAIYEHCPKLVENTAVENKKKIVLQTLGENTKIDKSMIEALGKLLDFVLKNSIKYGIEIPQDRIKKGKKETGLITINTEQINGQVVITFTDDGEGIDLKKIQENALLNKNVTKEEMQSMTDQDKTALILREKSMLQIKDCIDTLTGTITIETKKDIGTSISVFIPLTLSILDGLNIRVGTQYFILPTTSIIESLQPKENILKAVGDGSSELLMLREDFIPIIKLNEYFNIQSDYTKLIEGMLIVVKSGQEKVALFIDEFLQQQQIVVKPIDRNFKNVIGISGATVRGDSSIGLIIDVQSIIEDKKYLFDSI